MRDKPGNAIPIWKVHQQQTTPSLLSISSHPLMSSSQSPHIKVSPAIFTLTEKPSNGPPARNTPIYLLTDQIFRLDEAAESSIAPQLFSDSYDF